MTKTLAGRFTVRVMLVATLLLSMIALARPAWAETFTVTNTADDGSLGSLRSAVWSANADPASADIIEFSPTVRGEIALTYEGFGQLDLTNVEVRGPGAKELTIRRSDTASMPFRIFSVSSGSTASVSGLTISGGNTNFGGGINNDGTLTVERSTISGNTAGDAGGIHNSGTLRVEGSTISGNTSQQFGGGIVSTGGSTLTVEGSTITGNTTSQGGGGGIRNGGMLTVEGSTITGNTASRGGGIATGSTLTVRDSIVAGNSASINANIDGSFTDGGFNLIGGDPKLGPLQDNSGPTKTHALLPGSPAIDAGNSFGANTDQRGKPRPRDHVDISNAQGGDGSDIGANETQFVLAVPDSYTIEKDRTLRAAAPGVLANDLEGEVGPLVSSVISHPAHGELFLDMNGSFAYFPDSGYVGLDVFSYRVSDGVEVSEPAIVTITMKDVTPPDTTITDGLSGITRNTSASFSFTSTEADSTFQCSLDGSAFSACPSPKSYSGLKSGKHTFTVRAIDKAGNIDPTPAARSWTVDTIKPTVSAMSPKAGATITTTTPTITATVKDNLTNLQKKNIKLYVNGKLIFPTKYSYSATTDKLTYKSVRLPKGKRTVKIEATDAAGNMGAKSWYFTIK